jgi:uncharacterized protein
MQRAAVRSLLAVLLAVVPATAGAQQVQLPAAAAGDSALLDAEIPRVARALLGQRTDTDTLRHLSDRIRLHLAAGDPDDALATIAAIRARADAPPVQRDPSLVVLELHAHAMRGATADGRTFLDAYADAFRATFARLNDRDAFEVTWYLETPLAVFDRMLASALARVGRGDSLPAGDAVAVVRSHVLQRSMHGIHEVLPRLVAEDVERRYATDTSVIIRGPHGVTLSAVIVRPRAPTVPLPATLNFTIYTDVRNHVQAARTAASHGYVGIVADARGKRLSRDSIRPYETEVDDTHAVLDWIIAQPWSDGRVGMYGGSYEGFAAWAAAKRPHPALRTIVTYVAAIPGLGLPMENNVFLNANYAWPFFVANSRYLDHETYGDRERWGSLPQRWFASGRPYREIDQLDGTANPLLQRWIEHPSYDRYWQRMVPYGDDFARIDIPVLSITGYFDDGQVSAIHYVKEHLRHRPDAEHYLVIGPYDHFTAAAPRKPAELRGYTLDPAAHFSGPALTFEWFDHVFHGSPRPRMLRDRINHQVMGTNEWRHASSIEALHAERLRLYLTDEREGDHYRLAAARPARMGALDRVVDLGDRTTENSGYYPDVVVGREPEFGNALTFISEPLAEPREFSGSLSGVLQVAINKRDFDFNIVLYEVMPDGRLFHLTYFVGRASYAHDMTRRQLLTPGEVTGIPFERTRMTSRLLEAGSRLLLVVDVNKDAWHQVNHGTGRDVSDETAADAGDPLVVRLMPGSAVELPLSGHRSR